MSMPVSEPSETSLAGARVQTRFQVIHHNKLRYNSHFLIMSVVKAWKSISNRGCRLSWNAFWDRNVQNSRWCAAITSKIHAFFVSSTFTWNHEYCCSLSLNKTSSALLSNRDTFNIEWNIGWQRGNIWSCQESSHKPFHSTGAKISTNLDSLYCKCALWNHNVKLSVGGKQLCQWYSFWEWKVKILKMI